MKVHSMTFGSYVLGIYYFDLYQNQVMARHELVVYLFNKMLTLKDESDKYRIEKRGGDSYWEIIIECGHKSENENSVCQNGEFTEYVYLDLEDVQ